MRNAAWPAALARVDKVYGDRNVMCSCVPMSAYQGETPAAV